LPELDNPGWLRKRFETIYQTLAASEPTSLHGDPLDGALPPNYQNPVHAVVAIDGHEPPKRLEASGADDRRKEMAAYVHDLADKKAAG
jgi:hypothetical protein